ncbi:hypothetical protein D3C76_1721360 [compost metagenome]
MQDRYGSIMAEIMELAESTEHNMSAAQQILAGIEAQDGKIHEIVQHYQDLDTLILSLSATATGQSTEAPQAVQSASVPSANAKQPIPVGS